MKVILYIGRYEIGGTALQVLLSRKCIGLLKAGVLYPAVETRGFSRLAARAVPDEAVATYIAQLNPCLLPDRELARSASALQAEYRGRH